MAVGGPSRSWFGSRTELSSLGKNVRVLGLVSLLTDLGTEMVNPLLPIFLTVVIGVGTTYVGMIEGIAESTASLFKLLSGWLSDRSARRKPLVVCGYGISGLTRIFVATSTAGWHVLLARFIDRIGKGLRTAPRDALIAESTPPNSWGLAFGFHRAMDHFGAVLGSLAASVILYALSTHPEEQRYRILFTVATIPPLVGVALLARSLRETTRPLGAAVSTLVPLSAVLDTRLRRLLVATAVFTLGNSSDAFLLLRARELGMPSAALPLLWAMLHVVKSVSSIWGGSLSDRMGRIRVIVAGWLLYSGVYFGFALATGPIVIGLLFLVYGLYFGLTEGAEKALIADLVPAPRRATAYSLYHATIGLTALPASLLLGALWSTAGGAVAFATGAGFALVASAGLWLALPPPVLEKAA